MPLLLLFIAAAMILLLSTLRWRRTPEQRKACLRAMASEWGGEVSDYGDGGALEVSWIGHPVELRVYALPKEPLGVSTEVLMEMGPGLLRCEILGDRLLPALRRAVGLPEKDLSFEALFRDPTQSAAFGDPFVQERLMKLWALGPPKHMRLSCQDGAFMLSKDQDFCKPDPLRTFVQIAQELGQHLTQDCEPKP